MILELWPCPIRAYLPRNNSPPLHLRLWEKIEGEQDNQVRTIRPRMPRPAQRRNTAERSQGVLAIPGVGTLGPSCREESLFLPVVHQPIGPSLD